MQGKITIDDLQRMKREGRKSVGVVAWDYQIARIADRAGFDFISVGDSVGVNLWGRSDVLDVTLDEMLICCRAVRRGTERALISCDMPYGPVQQGSPAALAAARRLMQEGGADMIKLDAAADFPDVVRALADAGIPIFAQFGLTPQTAGKYGIPYSAQNSPAAQASAQAAATLVEEAKLLERAGAALLDFTNSGPVAGAAVVAAVKIPVIGGFGGGPWLDGRLRLAQTAIGYGEKWLEPPSETYANTAKAALAAFTALIADARAGRQIKG
jgi:3-methyl-2-oxobutanoate hydroxymethyltransferase